MTHPDFVAAYQAQRIRVRIDHAAAQRFVVGRSMLPIILLPLLGFAIALALVGYIIAGAALFAAALLFRFLVRRSSDGFVLWRSLRDADFYGQALAAQVLEIEECSTPSRSS